MSMVYRLKIASVFSALALSLTGLFVLAPTASGSGPAYTTTITADASLCRLDAVFSWAQVPAGAVYIGMYWSSDGTVQGAGENFVTTLAPGQTNWYGDFFGPRDGVRHRWVATGYFSTVAWDRSSIIAKKSSRSVQMTCGAA